MARIPSNELRGNGRILNGLLNEESFRFLLTLRQNTWYSEAIWSWKKMNNYLKHWNTNSLMGIKLAVFKQYHSFSAFGMETYFGGPNRKFQRITFLTNAHPQQMLPRCSRNCSILKSQWNNFVVSLILITLVPVDSKGQTTVLYLAASK